MEEIEQIRQEVHTLVRSAVALSLRLESALPHIGAADREEIYDAVRRASIMAGSQGKLARQIGVSGTYISAILNGRRAGYGLMPALKAWIESQSTL